MARNSEIPKLEPQNKEEEIELTEADMLDVQEKNGDGKERVELPGLPPEEETTEITDDMIVEVQDQNKSKTENLKDKLKRLDDKRHKEKGGDPTGKEVAEELKHLQDIEKSRAEEEVMSEKQAADTAKDKAGYEEAHKRLAKAKEMKGVKENMAELRSKLKGVKDKREADKKTEFTEQDKAWFKEGDELAEKAKTATTESKKTIPIEPYLAQIKAMGIPDFNYDNFDAMTTRHSKLDEELTDIGSGELKVGFLKKWRMNREMKKLNKELEPMWNTIDSELASNKFQKMMDSMTEKEREEYKTLMSKTRRMSRMVSNRTHGTSHVGNIRS